MVSLFGATVLCHTERCHSHLTPSKVSISFFRAFTFMITGAVSTTQRNVSLRTQPNTIFWIKIACLAAFGSLILIDSFYLILCYITVDFFGVLSNPLFAWLRGCGLLAWTLYFPTLLGALLSIDIGKGDKKAQRLAALFVAGQVIAGFALYFSAG